MRRWLCLLCLTAVLPAPTAKAYCNVPSPRLVCAEYFASQLVLEATLVQVKELHDEGDPRTILARTYTLRVNRTLRGDTAGNIRVYEGNDSGRATFDWIRGNEYLLFLFKGTEQNSWRLDGCGNSGPLSEASAALSEISKIKAASGGGIIHGVVNDYVGSVPVPGVHVVAQGAAGWFEATTDRNGKFELKVPVGQYAVRAEQTGSTFGKADISYENPRRVRIEAGGCAQIQFNRLEGTDGKR